MTLIIFKQLIVYYKYEQFLTNFPKYYICVYQYFPKKEIMFYQPDN